ncbi:MAG: HAD family phosphatase [Candidatus Aminicenantes bacterium]|nr:MAG: HAD family phosphatase [Candidatus Aminicenantes bacterium]
MIQCVISDLGKVILFFDNFIFFRKMADYCPFSADDIAERVHRHKELILSFDTGKIEATDFYREVMLKLEAKIGQETFFHIYNDVFSVNPPVLDLLRRLKTNNRLILLSNTDVERFGFIKKEFPEIFLFDGYVLSYEVGYMKPHREIYREALKKARVSAEECVFLDDLTENIEEARRIGMNAILYGPQTDLEVRLKQLNVTL